MVGLAALGPLVGTRVSDRGGSDQYAIRRRCANQIAAQPFSERQMATQLSGIVGRDLGRQDLELPCRGLQRLKHLTWIDKILQTIAFTSRLLLRTRTPRRVRKL